VVYKRVFPRLALGGTIHAYLAESLVATIEVKSNLTKGDFQSAVAAAYETKRLERHTRAVLQFGHGPPGILSCILAYDGPASMDTVYGWIAEVHEDLGIEYPEMPPSSDARNRVPSPALDTVCVIGRGIVNFDNFPLRVTDDNYLKEHPLDRWMVVDMERGALFWLFLVLSVSVGGGVFANLNPLPYMTGRFGLPGFKTGPG
jgi:hypothetical protein